MDCLPDNLRGRTYYHPTTQGKEKLLGQRLEEIHRLREQAGKMERERRSNPEK
jgi:putative ATPase